VEKEKKYGGKILTALTKWQLLVKRFISIRSISDHLVFLLDVLSLSLCSCV